ncbi:ATP-binding cassette domain-containing protein [Naumannella halotolerans]|uniref:Fructose transport system ATP-binding protein n=1 Tax=Naumannella halotolerans TaxID=993414 RepID=A0A4R7IZ02_9ACTN|nr:ATP-binding cassette domain-containing protein [Naumannella halotolerans]TDT29935.1 fructose transport system ATP-binding protein [Naumannella halotolerans]
MTQRETMETVRPVLMARGLVKKYGQVTAMKQADFDLYPGEVLAVVGDNGAGKSTLIKSLTGAVNPDAGTIELDGTKVRFTDPRHAREHGIETVYQTLAVAPSLDIATNMFLGRELRRDGPLGWLRILDRKAMRVAAAEQLDALGIATIQDMKQPVETLSGGQRQAVAVARAAMFGSKLVIMDEPTAALGVRETAQVLELIKRISNRGLPVVLISHDMPAVFEVADRIHVHRLGSRAGVVDPKKITMSDVVSFITGAEEIPESARAVR